MSRKKISGETCGWVEEGICCRLGPDEKGSCQADFECLPAYQVEKKKWLCTRPESCGGKCHLGPMVDGSCCRPVAYCHPQAAPEKKRRQMAIYAALLTASMVFLVLSLGSQSKWLSPGPLSFAHSIHEGEKIEEESCQSCHKIANGSWEKSSWDLAQARMQESRLCLQCHPHQGKYPLFAHGQSFEALTEISERIEEKASSEKKSLWISLGTPHENKDKQVACAYCHFEHRGRKADLKAISKHKCQVCHKEEFYFLGLDHPPFRSDYPYFRRPRIKFNHLSHEEHIENQKQKKCSSCHEVEGKRMGTRSFETTCFSCHQEEIQKSMNYAFSSQEVKTLYENLSSKNYPLLYPLITKMYQRDITVIDSILQNFHKILVDTLYFSERFLKASAKKETLSQWSKEGSLLDKKRKKLMNELEKIEKGSVEKITEIAEMLSWEKKIPTWSQWRAFVQQPTESFPGREDFEKLNPLFLSSQNKEKEILERFPHYEMKMNELIHRFRSKHKIYEKQWSHFGQRKAPSQWSWQKKDQKFQVHYQPAFHLDPLMKELVEASIKQNSPLLSTLKKQENCLFCHSLEKNQGELKANWKSKPTYERQKNFTHFDHSKHLKSLTKKGCQSCHNMTQGYSKKKFQEVYENLSSQKSIRNFEPISLETCSRCHQPERAGDECSTCHNYHVGQVRPAFPKNILQKNK